MASMSAVEIELVQDTEAERVRLWREDELGRAGYDEGAARILADRPDVDLHAAVSLLRTGCPAEIALRILL